MLNDFSWICYVSLMSTAVLQAFALGGSILLAKGPSAVFPRWVGYMNLWAGIHVHARQHLHLLQTGPFAYDGLIAWYLPVAFFAAIWIPVNSVYCLRAIDAHEREFESAESPAAVPGASGDEYHQLTAGSSARVLLAASRGSQGHVVRSARPSYRAAERGYR